LWRTATFDAYFCAASGSMSAIVLEPVDGVAADAAVVASISLLLGLGHRRPKGGGQEGV
jgi:hypothetical protein